MNTSARKRPATQLLTGSMDLRFQIGRFSDPVPRQEKGLSRLPGHDENTLLISMLREIHETVLPRRIKVILNSAESRYLYVTSRRLIGVSRSSDIEGEIAGTALEMVEQLGTMFAYASNAYLDIEHAAPGQIHPDSGSTALELAAALSVELVKTEPIDPVPTFFNSISSYLTAWVALDRAGNSFRNGGDSNWIPRLIELSKNGLEDIDTQLVHSLTATEHPGCVMLRFGDENGPLLAYARSNTSGFVAILPASHMAAVQAAWRKCLS